MITTAQEFEVEIAWERTVLALALPLSPLLSTDTNLDLRSGNIAIQVSSSMSDHAVEQFKNSLMPLLFGAAWKILDLAVELALCKDNRCPLQRFRWTIRDKADAIMQYGSLPGISPSSDLWRTLRAMYCGTVELRNALVHRRIKVDQDEYELIGCDSKGQPLTRLTAAQQCAFIRIAQSLAETVRAGLLSNRAEQDLRWQLSILRPHHQIELGASATPPGPPIRLADDFPANKCIDVPMLMAKARLTFSGSGLFDLELSLSDGRTLLAELDQAPSSIVTLDLNDLPLWIRFI